MNRPTSHGAIWILGVALCATLSGTAQAQIKPLSVLATRGGTLETGTYACRQQYNQAGYTYKVIEFNSATRYHWVHGGKSPGAMQTDNRSGKITFSSGKLANGFEAHYGKRADGAQVVVLVDTDLAPKADAYDYCTRRTDQQ